MDDLNDALDNLAKNSRNAAGTRVSRDVTASQGGIAAGRDVYLGPPPRRPHAVRRWLDRWAIIPLAAGAVVTMAIFLLTAYILYVLFNQLFEFIEAVIREASLHV